MMRDCVQHRPYLLLKDSYLFTIRETFFASLYFVAESWLNKKKFKFVAFGKILLISCARDLSFNWIILVLEMLQLHIETFQALVPGLSNLVVLLRPCRPNYLVIGIVEWLEVILVIWVLILKNKKLHANYFESFFSCTLMIPRNLKFINLAPHFARVDNTPLIILDIVSCVIPIKNIWAWRQFLEFVDALVEFFIRIIRKLLDVDSLHNFFGIRIK